MIIKRKEAEYINNINKWILLYGRRKTGKTFLVKNFVRYDKYFFVKRDKNIINEKSINYDTFKELLIEYIKSNKVVAIDEFHRLGDDFLDFLHSIGGGGKLILISSTLHLSKKILAGKSPLLGLVAEVPLSLIPLDVCFKEISKLGFSKKDALELAVFCREPIAIEYIKKGGDARDIIKDIFYTTKHLVPALLGEIFLEEEKSLSKVYEGILRAIAVGKNKAGEIANYLFSRKLIEKESSTMIQQYLKNLIDFGIIKKILLVNKSDYFYDLVSPLMKLYFYADEKYNFSEEATIEKAKLILGSF
jgi:AAA+ ATPase superfamily predicted ATPase